MPGDFTDLLAWQEACALVADIHALVPHIKGHGSAVAIDQIVSCAESISANIAEGYGRGMNRDFCRFLRIAIGSATELETRLSTAVGARRVATNLAQPSINRVRRVRALTVGLLHWVEKQIAKDKSK